MMKAVTEFERAMRNMTDDDIVRGYTEKIVAKGNKSKGN